MNKAAKQYLQKVNKQIHYPSSIKRSFCRQFKNEVLSFCDDHENADMALLVETFGSPEEVTEEFFAELGNLAAGRYLFTRRKLLFMTAGIFLGAVLLVLAIDMRTNFLKEQLLKEGPVASIIYEGESEKELFRLPAWYNIFGEEGNDTAAPAE